MTPPLPLEPANFVELLRLRAEEQADQNAFTFLKDGENEEAQISYAELDRQARIIGAQLQNLVASGQRALLLYPPGLEYVAAFFGCLYAGVVAVPTYPPDPIRLDRTLPRLQAIAKDAQVTVVLTTQDILDMSSVLLEHSGDLKSLQWLAANDLNDELAEQWQQPQLSGDAIAFLQYTSGSTGSPRGVMVSHGNLMHNSEMISNAFGVTPQTRGVIWLPPYHDMGLIGGILAPLHQGIHCTLMSPLHFLERPFRWLQTISHIKGTHSGGPNFAYDLCVRKITPEQRAGLDLSSWNLAFCGAEPIRNETIDRFVETFGSCGLRRESFYPCYGLAEATLIVSGGRKSAAPIVKAFRKQALQKGQGLEAQGEKGNGQILVGCGQSLANQEIVIVDPESMLPCPPARIGEIWVSGPSVAQGYWNRPKETQETFKAHLMDTEKGPFLRTGDLGFLQNGELFVTGRIKDLIIIRGQNHYPQNIELTVENSVLRLRRGCGAAFSVEVEGEEKLVIVQEVDTRESLDGPAMIANIRRAVATGHDIQAHAIVLIKPRGLPKTSSGKVQRHACREHYLAGTLDVVEEWQEQPVVPRRTEQELDPTFRSPVGASVLKVLQEVLPGKGDDTVMSSLSLDLELDSLSTIEFWTTLEQTFGMTIPEQERLILKEVGPLVTYITERQSSMPRARVSSRNSTGLNWTDVMDIETEEVKQLAHQFVTYKPRYHLAFLWVFRHIIRRLSKLQLEGIENLPTHGPYILASKHVSKLDYPFVASLMPRPIQKNLVVIARKDYYSDRPIMKWLVSKLGRVPMIDVFKASLLLLQVSAQVLKQGKVLLMFPEMICPFHGQLLPFKSGVGLLANHMQCPIIPVYIKGAYEFFPKEASFPRGRGDISVILGKPLKPNPDAPKMPSTRVLAEAEAMTEKLRMRIIAMSQS